MFRIPLLELAPDLKTHEQAALFARAEVTFEPQITFNTLNPNNCGVMVVSNFGFIVGKGRLYAPDFSVQEIKLIRKLLLDPWETFFAQAVGNVYLRMKVDAYGEKLQKENLDSLFLTAVDEVTALNHNCYFLSDQISKEAGVKTRDFAEFLIRKKIGFVVKSPLSINHVHQAQHDFSLIRCWIWYPPGSLAFKDEKYLGKGKPLESKEEVADRMIAGACPNFQRETKAKTLKYLDMRAKVYE